MFSVLISVVVEGLEEVCKKKNLHPYIGLQLTSELLRLTSLSLLTCVYNISNIQPELWNVGTFLSLNKTKTIRLSNPMSQYFIHNKTSRT